MNIAVLASGRGTNLEAICTAIDEGRLPARVVAVISDRSDAGALERARRRGIPAHDLGGRPRAALFEEIHRLAREAGAEVLALAGFMRILPPWLVQAWRWRVMNIHPSLLPAFPGLDAPRQALEYGVRITGCTVHFVDEGVDTGPIILQAAVPVEPDDDVASLTARIQREEHRIYPQALALYAEGRLRVVGRHVQILPRGGC